MMKLFCIASSPSPPARTQRKGEKTKLTKEGQRRQGRMHLDKASIHTTESLSARPPECACTHTHTHTYTHTYRQTHTDKTPECWDLRMQAQIQSKH
eukprot:1147823-Pelagomonas_calceolata.AAC.6